MSSRCQVLSKYSICTCTDVYHCTCVCVCGELHGACVYEPPGLLVQNNCLQEFTPRVWEWTSRSDFDPAQPSRGAACRRMGVRARPCWRVSRRAGPRRGLTATRAPSPGGHMDRKAHVGPAHWPLPATQEDKGRSKTGGFSPPGPSKLGWEGPAPPTRAPSSGLDAEGAPRLAQ